MHRILILIGFCLLFAAPLAAQTTSDDSAPVNDVSVSPAARDEQIAERIGGILDATGWFNDVSVGVEDGIVFLDGTADSDDHRVWARDLAAKTQDVVAVVNRITVSNDVNWSFAPAASALEDVLRRVVRAGPLVLLALVILPITWWLSSFVARSLRRFLLGGLDSPFLRSVTSRILALPIFLLGIYVVLQTAGLTQLAFSVVGGAGVIGIIFGFAFRDIAENFLASLLLSIRQPFRAGDLIDVQGMRGSVLSMNTRSTILISPEGNHIQIPNSVVFKNIITNFTASPEGRVQVEVGIGYDASISEAQDVIAAVLAAHDAVLDDPKAMVLVDTLGSSTVNLIAYFWIDVRKYAVIKVKSSVLRLMKKALMDAGISMPDDAREIIFPQGVPISREGPARLSIASERSEAETPAEDSLGNDQAEVVERAVETADLPEDKGNLLD